MKKFFNFSIFLLMVLPTQSATAEVLHWLSQIQANQQAITNHTAELPKISTNGRYVTYLSSATNLFHGDHNQATDIFWHDLQTQETKLVNSTANGTQYGAGSYSKPTSDGRYVAFLGVDTENPTGGQKIYIKNMDTGEVTNHTDIGNGSDFVVFSSGNELFLSDDGLFITFQTSTGIDPLDDDHFLQIYRKDILNDTFELISTNHDGTADFNSYTRLIDVSDNGRYVLMAAEATNVVATPLNNSLENLYVRDLQNGTNTLVTVTPSGDPAATDDIFFWGAVSNTGTVAFSSSMSDLVNGDTNNKDDVFYFNGSINQRINVKTNGEQVLDEDAVNVDISGDGTRVVFTSDTNELVADYGGHFMVYSYEVQAGTLSLVTQNDTNQAANNSNYLPKLSLNGSTVVFETRASNLSSEFTNPNHRDLLAYRFESGNYRKITQVVFNPDTVIDRVLLSKISSDQLSVIFTSPAANLTDQTPVAEGEFSPPNNLYLLNRADNQLDLIAAHVASSDIDISSSGRYIVYGSKVSQPDGAVTFTESHVYLFDRNDGSHTLIEEGFNPKVNNEGNLSFTSDKGIANNDNNGGTDVYFYDSDDSSISLVSETTSGDAAGAGSKSDLGGQGNNTWVVFESVSGELIPADTNGRFDIFMHNPDTGVTIRASQTSGGIEGDSDSLIASISENGQFVVFFTYADNLGGAVNSEKQIMVYDRVSTLLELASIGSDGNPMASITDFYSDVSDSGRYVIYGFNDQNAPIGVSGDDDFDYDAVIYDRETDTSKIISVDRLGQAVDDDVQGFSLHVVEDLSVTPPLVGALFTARDPDDLTDIPNHPGHAELFLFQQGGPDVNLDLQIVGMGSVSGTTGINCSSACDYDFALGTDLTLIASPAADYEFVGWMVEFGGCDQAAQTPCDVIMDRSKTVTAVFEAPDLIFANSFE